MSFGQSNFGYSSSGLSPALVSTLSNIPTAAWTTIGLINQGLATTSSPTFYDLTLSDILKVGSPASTGTGSMVYVWNQYDITGTFGSVQSYSRIRFGDTSSGYYAQTCAILPPSTDITHLGLGIATPNAIGVPVRAAFFTSVADGSNMCIGTSLTPTERLHVEGNIRASGSLKLDSGAFKSIITPTALAADRTLTLPDSNLTLTAHSGPNQALSTNNTPTFASTILVNPYTNSVSHASEELSKLTLGHSGYSPQIGAYLPQDSTVNAMSLAISTPDNTGTLHRQIFIGAHDAYSGRVVIGSSVAPTERLCIEGNIYATGSLKLESGSFVSTISPLTLTANTTLYLPNSNLTLTQHSGPNQQLDTTGTPTFADISITDRLSFPDFTEAKNMSLLGFQAGGANALTSYSHYTTAIGYQACNSINGSINSTAVGWKALTSVSTGSSNTALGCSAGITLTTGTQNTYLGAFSDAVSSGTIYSVGIGYSNLCASGCIFIGRNIGPNIQSSATNNTVIGPDGAGAAITTGASNLLLGQQAGNGLTTGSFNTSVGFQAGKNITSGDYNICIGTTAQTAGASDSDSIVIGHNATGLGSNTTVIGNSSTTNCRLYGELGLDAATALTLTLGDTGTPFTIASQSGYKQMIGKWLHFNFTITWSDKGTATQVLVSGIGATFSGTQAVTCGPISTVGPIDIRALAVNGTDSIYFYKMTAGAYTNAAVADMPTSGTMFVSGRVYIP